MTKVLIFVRVSSGRQDYQRQISELQAYAHRQGYEVVDLIAETISASKQKTKRTDLYDLLVGARQKKFTKVLTTEVTRLGRNKLKTLQLLQELTELKVSVYAKNIGVETLTPDGKKSLAASILFSVIAELAEVETELLKESINSGLAEARRQGKRLGTPQGSTLSDQALLEKYPGVVKDLKAGESVRRMAAYRSIAPMTVQRVKKVILANVSIKK